MKKVMLLLVVSFLLAVPSMNSNIISTNPTAPIRVKITNLSEFPDVTILSYTDAYKAEGNIRNLVKFKRVDLIAPNDLLTPYTLGSNPTAFYVVKKDYLKKVTVDSIDWSTDNHAQKLNIVVKTNSCMSYVYSAVGVEFKLAKRNNKYYVYKSRMTYSYLNSAPSLVTNFANEVVDIDKPFIVETKRSVKR